MEIYFFTAATADYLPKADRLLRSARRFGVAVALHRIPPEAKPWRFKVRLWRSALPAADKYVYLDADCLLVAPGDWSASGCNGAAELFHQCGPEEAVRRTRRMIRDRTRGDGSGCEAVTALWQRHGCPPWRNSGVMALEARQRWPVTALWSDWIERTDALIARRHRWADELGLLFAAAEAHLPVLPGRFLCPLKWQRPPADVVVLSADGNAGPKKIGEYYEALRRLEAWERSQGIEITDPE
jgi:hypothetical protein